MSPHVPKAKLLAAFAAIYFIWGSTYLAIRFAIETIPPFMTGGTRFLIAGSLLYSWTRLRSGIRPTPRQWLHALILGTFLLGVGNGCVVWAQQHIASGLAALVVAIVPLLVVLIEWLRPAGRRPSGTAAAGVLIGLAGMALLIGPSAFLGSNEVDLLAALVLLTGSLSWSMATVFGKRADVPEYPAMASAMQLLGGGLALSVASVLAGDLQRLDVAGIAWQSYAALAYLVIFGSIVAFSAYSWLLRVAPPAKIATYAYVNPVVAIFLGWAVAGEQLTGRTLVAAGIVLAGVVLITRRAPTVIPDSR